MTPTISIELSDRSLVQGQPFELRYHIRAATPVTLPMAPAGNDPSLLLDFVLPDGGRVSRPTGESVPAPGLVKGPLSLKAGEAYDACISYGALAPSCCNPGRYKVRVRYRLDSRWKGYPGYDGFLQQDIASDWMNLVIESPRAEDARLWAEYQKENREAECGEFVGWCTQHEARIVSEFPLSTYAGFALLGFPDSLGPMDVTQPLRRVLAQHGSSQYPPAADAQGGRETQMELSRAKERANALSRYLRDRGDFVRADWIRLLLAGDLATVGRYAEAKALCDGIIAAAPASDVAKSARALLSLLKEKSLI